MMAHLFSNAVVVVGFCLLSVDGVLAKPVQGGLVTRVTAGVDRAVEAEMKRQQAIGCSIGVLRDGKLVYAKGYGFANREEKLLFTTKTVTNWASNSKPIVAVAAMQLVEKDKLALEDEIRKYLPELPASCDGVSIRHILCHQSGYPHYTNGKIVKLAAEIESGPDGHDPLYSIKHFGGSPLIRPPGEMFSYSSYAFVLLSAAIQRAGGEALPKQVETRITDPIGMDSFELDTQSSGQANWSVGYRRNGEGKVVRVEEYANYWKHGAGGYKSNIVDFSKWAESLINRELISAKSERLLWTPQKLSSGKVTRMGLGFYVNEGGGRLQVSHSGSHPEARSSMVLYPREKSGVVVLCNTGHVDAARISSVIFKALPK